MLRYEQGRQIAHMPILEARLADHQQPRPIARPHRILRDQVCRQVKLEELSAHDGPLSLIGRKRP